MTVGERIRYIREFRGLTQKELGVACGFPEASADVRIRQYESNAKTPKSEIMGHLCDILKVHNYAIMPYAGDAFSIFEILLWLDTFGDIELFKLDKEFDKYSDWELKGAYNDFNYVSRYTPIGINVTYPLVSDYMQEWFQHYLECKNNTITKEQYINWKLNWPASCDTNRENERLDWRNM